MKNPNWNVGMMVRKVFHGIGGYRETSSAVVTRINKKTRTIYVDDETGITYDLNGREKENFFPPMYSEIIPSALLIKARGKK